MLKRIAVHLNADAGCQRRIDAAITLATTHNAELIGVYPSEVIPQHGYGGTAMPEELRGLLSQRALSDREKIHNEFTEKAKAAGITAHWRTPKGPVEEVLALHARYCRLLVMSKAEDRHSTASPISANVPETVIMSAGRPVLMVPTVGAITTIGERILFCWDQKREAARAFMDAAPLLRNCKELVVLIVDEDADKLRNLDIQGNDFSDLCAAQGYPAPKIMRRSSEGIGVGNVILNTSTDCGSDLIIMGAYGHSRMRQWIMGGASRTLLSSMAVPVMLSH